MNDTKYFTVEADCIDGAQVMVNLLCSVKHIFARERCGTVVNYRVEGTFEERKAAYKKVRRLGRGKVRFAIVLRGREL